MNIAWFSWKDIGHPLAGGAERVGHEWRRRLVRDGHAVRHITARYRGSLERDTLDGVDTIRCGRFAPTHYPAALVWYRRCLGGWPDVVIEEINTVPYFSRAVAPRTPVVLFYHQLAREIWFYETRWPIAVIGYAAEAAYTRLLARVAPDAMVGSPDTRQDLLRFGFRGDRVHVVPYAIDNLPLSTYDAGAKHATFVVLFHGSLRAMKRPLHALDAFHQFASRGGAGELWFSGGGSDRVLREFTERHQLTHRVRFLGRTSEADKLSLMQKASVVVATSVKEGWGLIVTEANSMATPVIAYDVDGLRSAAGSRNWVCAATPAALSRRLDEALRLFADRPLYDQWCRAVLEASRGQTQDRSYRSFAETLHAIRRPK